MRESKRVHAVWVILGSKDGAGVAKEEASFGGESSEEHGEGQKRGRER